MSAPSASWCSFCSRRLGAAARGKVHPSGEDARGALCAVRQWCTDAPPSSRWTLADSLIWGFVQAVFVARSRSRLSIAAFYGVPL